jgi:peptide methionine sulfoxide reductase msrA/msrB
MDKLKSLNPTITDIVRRQGTEAPHTGKFDLTDDTGSYLCRQCGLALFCSSDKFLSQCGWPSFDDELPNTIKRRTDADGSRTEIRCQRCDAHLGHVFLNEGLTEKNCRHCVNSLSLDFVKDTDINDTEEAIYAGGCFWGVQYLLDQTPGVLYTEVGYTGGQQPSPTYESVCTRVTGHLEAIRVLYNPAVIDYQHLTQRFLEIHDPSQQDGQGPDLGAQYLSAIFYYNDQQKECAQSLLTTLKRKGLKIATKIEPTTIFWPAEEDHQSYYQKTGKTPYCHIYTQRF